ncbi:MAG: geranylgeranylglycerol-phosphate geranylgeranyltransferase [Fibrobacteraceae bacterium]|nr:geranylgeranylglycerol-phosphate geranylgeranyltransferase [Fibrobacteraceae bacterium]
MIFRNFLGTFKAICELARPTNALVAVVALLIGYLLQEFSPPLSVFVGEAIAIFFAVAFGNALNDIQDLSTDKVNKPLRPIPSQRISLKGANTAAIAFAIVSLIAGSISGIFHAAFFCLLNLLLFAYDYKFKRLPFAKNPMVALLCTAPLFLTLLNSTANFKRILFVAAFAFLLTLAREIYKDIEDFDGDERAGILTLSRLIGQELSSKLATFTLVLAIFLMPLPEIFGIFSPLFFLCAAPLVIIPTILALKKAKTGNFKAAQKMVKIAMLGGLASAVISLGYH